MARRDNNIRRGFGTKSTGFGSGCTWFIGTVQTQHSNRARAMYKEALPSTAPITPVYQNTIRQHQNDRIEQPGDTQVRKDKAGVSSHNWWYRIRCFTFFSQSCKLYFPEIYGANQECLIFPDVTHGPLMVPGRGPKRFHDSFNIVFCIVGECISCAADTHMATDLTC